MKLALSLMTRKAIREFIITLSQTLRTLDADSLLSVSSPSFTVEMVSLKAGSDRMGEAGCSRLLSQTKSSDHTGAVS